MNRRSLALAVVSFSSVFVGTGCMPSMTMEEMKAMMPKRPVELDKLNVFVGTWDATGTGTFAGMDDKLTSTGTSEAHWEGDGWYLVEKGTMQMAGFDDMNMRLVWAYDANAGVYRNNWVDSMGSFGVGTARHDEKTNTWHFKAKSHSPFGTSTSRGEYVFLDSDSYEWTWTEYAMGGLIKTMDMHGTAKRRR